MSNAPSSATSARDVLPLPRLMARLGDAQHARRSARCPFHKDAKPSFSVFLNRQGRWFWKCFAGCGHGDEVDYLRKKFDLSTAEAVRQYCEMAGVGGKGEAQ